MNVSNIPVDRYKNAAFSLGLQYLSAGRFCVAGWLLPVSGNLLHHAIEMFLKGCLVEHVGCNGLPRGRNGHDLNCLWQEYRRHVDNPSLDCFTSIIANLHDFEKIRYPERLIQNGGLLTIGFASEARATQHQGPNVPEYQIGVEDIDALVKTLFELGNVNPKFYQSMFDNEHARRYLNLRNKSPLILDS